MDLYAVVALLCTMHKNGMWLSKEIKIAIRKELRQECRQEAIKILTLGDDQDREDFLKYHNLDMGNLCCLALDFAKKKLIEARKWELNEKDCFNDPNAWLDAK
jgi:hypothetical protein